MSETEIFPLRGEAHHPWHLYVSVVLLGEEHKIPLMQGTDGAFQLPRRTLLSSENFVQAVHQLVLETIHVVPQVTGYLGSVTTIYTRYDGSKIEKTVLYFEAHFESAYHGRFSDAPPSDELTWVSLGEAFDLLSYEAHGEEMIVERAGVSHRVFAA